MKKFTILKSALMVAALYIGGSAFAQNLVTNPNFEQWADGKPTGWNVMSGSVCVQETTDTDGLPSAVKISQEAKDAAKVGQYVNGLEDNVQYTISCNYKVLNTSKAENSFRPWLRWQHYENGTGTWIDPVNDTEKQKMQGDYAPDNLNKWSKYSITVTAPATTTTIHVDLRIYNGANVLVNNVSVMKAGGSSIRNAENGNRIYANNGVVTVRAEKTGNVEVYNLLGQKVMTFQVKEGDNNLSGLSRGQVYMVKFAGKAQKVVL